MPRWPYCYKRYFELGYAVPQTKYNARQWFKMAFPDPESKLVDVENGLIVLTNFAWYGKDKEALEALVAEETEALQ